MPYVYVYQKSFTIIRMKQELARSKSRRKQGRCCYNLSSNQPDEQEPSKTFFERMPMLGREISSKIHFKNVEHNNSQPIYELLNDLYEGANPGAVYPLLSNKRINPIVHGSEDRDDLEYYVPQIVTYLVLQKNLQDNELALFILKGCTTDFYFAHRVYFYLKSLSGDHNGQRITSVEQFLTGNFLEKMQIYFRCKLSGIELTKSMVMMDQNFKGKQIFSELVDEFQHDQTLKRRNQHSNRPANQDQLLWEQYGTKHYPSPPIHNPKTIPKPIRKRYCEHGFIETPQFWDDLLNIGNRISKMEPKERNENLNLMIQQINLKLPADVYIPFFKEYTRYYTILCAWKGRLFATKERAPYSIWLEIYRQEEELNLAKVPQIEQEEGSNVSPKKQKKNFLAKLYETISKPFSINGEKNTLNIKQFLTEKLSAIDESLISRSKKSKMSRSVSRSFVEEVRERHYSLSDVYDGECHSRSELSQSEGRHSSSVESALHEDGQVAVPVDRLKEYFGPKSSQFTSDVREKSIYRDLKSWRLVHLMIKTGDDIKQEQFAMQLINRFQYAFKKEKIDCLVFPYEVISLGPDCGLIEMLNDVTTISNIFEKISKKMTLRQFFDRVYPNPNQARRNFMKSLAGYSLLTYFLQVKDRHNGNILLHRDGYIIHIDFGFFLSNAPGRGVELEKKMPFKLLTEYVDVIGSLNSEEFFQFRRLFYKGFSAILKHREAILALVRMMYSSHSQSMACFIRGQQAIQELEERFAVHHNVQSFCYDLISSSLDNWRARWYDKFQYFLQKIYY